VALEGLSLTTSQDVLLAIADGVGPKSLITLGYAGWEAGQLEAELADNAWLTCPFDPTSCSTWPANCAWKRPPPAWGSTSAC
jgi:putative AlgH/UPF0301 family transcriptional regulator